VDKNTKKWLLFGIVIMVLGAIALSGDDMDDVIKASEEKSKALSKSEMKQGATQLAMSGKCEDIFRMVAPDANELLLAARLLEGAADRSYAAATVKLQKARDLAITEAETWRFKAEEAKSREEYARAQVNLKRLQEETSVKVTGDRTQSTATGLNVGSSDASELNESQDDTLALKVTLRFRGQNEKTGNLLFQKGDEWFRHVKEGHFIDNVEIRKYNPETGCVSLAIDGQSVSQKLCLN
jgi:hypothetical protein